MYPILWKGTLIPFPLRKLKLLENKNLNHKNTTQQTGTCSKSTIEILEKSVKYVHS